MIQWEVWEDFVCVEADTQNPLILKFEGIKEAETAPLKL